MADVVQDSHEYVALYFVRFPFFKVKDRSLDVSLCAEERVERKGHHLANHETLQNEIAISLASSPVEHGVVNYGK